MFNIHRHGGFVKGEYPIVRLAVVCACRAETCPTEQPYMVPQQEGRRPTPAIGWGRRPCGIRRGDCAICGWRVGTIGVFRPLRRATRGAASGLRDLGCPPPVGKSGRRGIFRQSKVRVRSHTGCMARNRTAAMAEKARRAPQTHGRWVALTRKKSSKFFPFGCDVSIHLFTNLREPLQRFI